MRLYQYFGLYYVIHPIQPHATGVFVLIIAFLLFSLLYFYKLLFAIKSLYTYMYV